MLNTTVGTEEFRGSGIMIQGALSSAQSSCGVILDGWLNIGGWRA